MKMVKKEIKKYLKTNEKWKQNIPKLIGCMKSSSNRKVYSDKCLHEVKKKKQLK